MFAGAGMMAADGRCKTLDAAADGYVRGEAVVLIKLRYVLCRSAIMDRPFCRASICSMCARTSLALPRNYRSIQVTPPASSRLRAKWHPKPDHGSDLGSDLGNLHRGTSHLGQLSCAVWRADVARRAAERPQAGAWRCWAPL